MRSLSQILKQMPVPAMEEVEKKRQELLKHPLVQNLRQTYTFLTEEDLKPHMTRLYQYVREYTHCSQCPGLERCPNDFAGHYTKLTVEGDAGHVRIYDHKVACKKWVAKQNSEMVRKRVRSFYVDERALNEGYSAEEIITIDPERTKAAKQVLEYIVKTKKHGLQKRGLYLVGTFGTGKTFMMCYMLHELAKSGYTGVIVYMPDFIEDLKSMIKEPERLNETIELLKTTDLLVFDDIGAENLNPWVRDHVMGSILNYRMNRKPTFYTSNYELDALEKHFSFTNKDGDEQYKGKRLMDRIRPFVDTIVVKGTNKRGMNL